MKYVKNLGNTNIDEENLIFKEWGRLRSTCVLKCETIKNIRNSVIIKNYNNFITKALLIIKSFKSAVPVAPRRSTFLSVELSFLLQHHRDLISAETLTF